MGRFRSPSEWLLWAPAVAVSAIVAIPLVYLAVRALSADPQQLAELVLRRRSLVLVGNTLLLAGGVLSVGTAAAVPLAWLVTRSDLRGRRLLTILGVLPLAIPGYVTAFVLLSATGPTGAVASLAGWPIPRVSGYWGALWALSVYTFPYLFLNLRAGMLGLDPALEESARSLGRGPSGVLGAVVLPQLRPAYLSGALLVVLHVVGDFGVVSLMRFETLSYALYLQYAGAFDRVYAAWIAIGLLLVTAGFLFAESRLLPRFSGTVGGSRRFSRHARVPLGRWRPAALGFVTLLLVQCLLLPGGTLLYWALRGQSFLSGPLFEALLTSFSAAVPAAGIAVALAVPVAYIAVRRRGPAARLVDRMAWFGYATPPLAFALGLVVFSLQSAPGLYQTMTLLLLAYAVHFLAEAMGPIRTGLVQTPAAMHEAARSLGRSPLHAFRRITLPLLRPGLMTGVAFVFLAVMKELPLTFLLSPIGFDTLALNVWTLTNEALYGQAAPYALCVVGFSAGFVGLLIARERIQ